MSDRIERINEPARFSLAEIRAGVAETKRLQAQPGFAEKEKRRGDNLKSRGIRFPELAKSRGTKPVIASTDIAARRLNLIK